MKKLFVLFTIICAVALLFSCGKTSDDTAIGLDEEGYYTRGSVEGEFAWSLNGEGVLTVTMDENNKARRFDASNSEYLLSIEPLRDKVIHMEIAYFPGRISYSAEAAETAVGSGARNLCASMPNLVSVHFCGDRQSFWVEENGEAVNGLFYGASSLKTVWFGNSKNENVVDLSGASYGTPSNRKNYFSKSLLFGCSSVEAVILSRHVAEICENTFKGCTSLAFLTLDTGIKIIESRAFSDCTALREIIIEASKYTVGEDAFPDNNGLVISVKNPENKSAIKESSKLTGAEFIVPLNDYWIEHIDAKLASMPKGKSFIIYTDTHFQSSMNRNTRKAASLVQYVREKTGIKTVIHLGDPYSKEKDIETANKLFITSMEEYFFDIFGKDGLFAVGNHDANYTRWMSYERADDATVQVEGENGCGAFNYILPDTNIYEGSVAHIADVVSFDDALIEKLELLDYKAVGEENGWFVTSEGKLPQVYYSAEDMKEQAYAWAKMHYHIDDEEQKIRYIVLDTGNCGLTTRYTMGNALWTAILPTQFDWLAETLRTVPEGYDVAVVGHMLSHYTEGKSGNKEIYQILSAFRAGKSVDIYANAKNHNMRILVGDANKKYDFSDIDFSGTVFTMSGHWHRDSSFVWYTDESGAYNTNVEYRSGDALPGDAIFYIGLNNDCLDKAANDTAPKMTRGDETENSFTIVTVADDGDIYLTRIGAGEDRVFSYN